MKQNAQAYWIIVGLLYAFVPKTWGEVITVRTTADFGVGCLRQAIADANALPGVDSIFIEVQGTIALLTPLPAVSDSVRIEGLGFGRTVISGGDSVSIIAFNSKTTNEVSGLTFSRARLVGNGNGAAISNAGTLSITGCAFVNNHNEGGWGGAVFNNGRLTIDGSSFDGNSVVGEMGGIGFGYASGGGGGAGMGGAIFTWGGQVNLRDCLFSSNTATDGDGGPGLGSGRELGPGGRGGGANGGPGGSSGGFGGGGGGAPWGGAAGWGGYGGGGGGGGGNGQGGFGGAHGETWPLSTGGGGAGLGGGVFVRGGSLDIVDCVFTNNGAFGGRGGTIGFGLSSGFGADVWNYEGRLGPALSVITTGGGQVRSIPAAPPYLDRSIVSVVATPDPGWHLIQTLGDVAATNGQFDLHIRHRSNVEVVFGTRIANWTQIASSPFVDVFPWSESCAYGSVVKFTALPPLGTYLAGWEGASMADSNPLLFTVTNANPRIAPIFGVLGRSECSLAVLDVGLGHVLMSPQSTRYQTNATVVISAIAELGQEFLGWGGDLSTSENPVSIQLHKSMNILAKFTARPRLRVGTPAEGSEEDGFRISVIGELGRSFEIQGTIDSGEWVSLGEVTNTFGTAQFMDMGAKNLPRRFYRAHDH